MTDSGQICRWPLLECASPCSYFLHMQGWVRAVRTIRKNKSYLFLHLHSCRICSGFTFVSWLQWSDLSWLYVLWPPGVRRGVAGRGRVRCRHARGPSRHIEPPSQDCKGLVKLREWERGSKSDHYLQNIIDIYFSHWYVLETLYIYLVWLVCVVRWGEVRRWGAQGSEHLREHVNAVSRVCTSCLSCLGSGFFNASRSHTNNSLRPKIKSVGFH